MSENDEDLKRRELDCLVINSTIATIDPGEELFPILETPAREFFAHNVKIGLINEDGTLGPKLRPQPPADS